MLLLRVHAYALILVTLIALLAETFAFNLLGKTLRKRSAEMNPASNYYDTWGESKEIPDGDPPNGSSYFDDDDSAETSPSPVEEHGKFYGLDYFYPRRPFKSQPEYETDLGFPKPPNLPVQHLDDKDDEECNLKSETVFFKGACVKILAKGQPCKSDEWLVLNETPPHEPICRPIPCGGTKDRVLGQDGHCYDMKFLRTTCKAGEHLIVDFYGKAFCECGPGRVYWVPHDMCYLVYEQGPCSQGQVLTINSSNVLSCQVNPCSRERQILWSDGKCHTLGTLGGPNGPCDENYYLEIDQLTLHPKCEGLDFRSILFLPLKGCAAGSKRDFFGQCDSGLSWVGFFGKGVSACFPGYIRNPTGRCVKFGT